MAAVDRGAPPRAPRYRSRRPLPAIALIVLLAAVAAVVWINVLNRQPAEAAGCGAGVVPTTPTPVPGQPPPPVPPPPGTPLPADGLDAVAPAPPGAVRVQVLNGNGERGQAGVVAEDLGGLGFGSAGDPDNDPLHPDFDLTCYGQIRFGTAGEAAARTLSLVAPCAELVRDVRTDDVVSLALGTTFRPLEPNEAAQGVLTALGPVPPGQPPPPLDPQALTAARATTGC